MKTILETEDTKYILLHILGYGGTCSVYKGYCADDKSFKLYAIKIFKPDSKKYFEREINVNDTLPKKYFLSVFKYGIGHIQKESTNSSHLTTSNNIFTGNVFYKIEEFAENGELFNYVYQLEKGFPEKVSAKIFAKIVKSVKILHENNIVHCDIKPENILVGNDFNLKLIDFGFSKKINKDHVVYGNEGSEIYSSPETRKGNNSGYDGIKNDIFSLGVLLFVITIGRFPFNSSKYSDKKYRLIMFKKYEQYWSNYEKYNLSNEFKDLMNHLICYQPNERFNIDEILEHPWIKNNVNNKKEINKENDVNDTNTNDANIVDEEIVKELKERKVTMSKKTN